MWDLSQYEFRNLAFKDFLQGPSGITKSYRARTRVLTFKTILSIRYRSFGKYLGMLGGEEEPKAGS